MNFPQKIKERFIQSDYTILQSLKRMDLVNKKLLLVFNNDKFVGVLSIGDIQKAIISNLPLSTPIKELMREDFLFAKKNDDKNDIFQIMQKYRIECMPVLNDDLHLIKVYLWEDVFGTTKRKKQPQLNLPVIIMAGGEGKRLKPLTNILPKPLIPIGEKTIIEQIMDKFCDVGCNTFYLSVNYKAEMIKYYFSALENKKKYKVNYFQEKDPLGTAGSLYLLRGKINSTFFVTNCDILLDQNIDEIIDYHRKNNNEVTIVAALKHYSLPYGILESSEDGLLKAIKEKPELSFKINTGFYILEPHLLNEIPVNTFYHITSLIEKLHQEKRNVGVFPISEKSWKDIGEWDEYIENAKTE